MAGLDAELRGHDAGGLGGVLVPGVAAGARDQRGQPSGDHEQLPVLGESHPATEQPGHVPQVSPRAAGQLGRILSRIAAAHPVHSRVEQLQRAAGNVGCPGPAGQLDQLEIGWRGRPCGGGRRRLGERRQAASGV